MLKLDSNYELECNSIDRPLPKGKHKKVIVLMKDELAKKIMATFTGLRTKSYSYLIDDGSEDKKAKDKEKCVIKRKLKFENYKSCLEGTQPENKINHLEKNKFDTKLIKENYKEFIKINNGTSKDSVSDKEEIKCNNIIKRHKK